MKIASFVFEGEIRYGLVEGDRLHPVSVGFQTRFPSLRAALAAERLGDLAADARHQASLPLDTVTFLPPVPDAARVICVGINYPKRYPLDANVGRPENIILFAKLPGTLLGHGMALEVPDGEAAETFDYEGEIAVVIGRQGRHIPAEKAHEYIAGFTAFNDGSVRGWQKHSVHAGKNFAGSGACGPWIVTADEIDVPEAMTVTTRLNGQVVQHAPATDMFFSIPEVIAYISHLTPIEPGDVIAMGSPDGSGGSRVPPRFLRDGDVLEIEVSGVGMLVNTVGASQEEVAGGWQTDITGKGC
ncbi:fumarylacetoacetate hydrolase family protein [Defluviimonas sp. WL0050]|uniref:Fumarylacetoacetate hydrolase family protein n=1 Tax=Albidovulum litorale TaxID=2984134 RepID=A0ABT2ZTU2_9RHOB|nr:fumarylacetoacetate hydrolase family protein [Defluviimonas sp. WL0050]MCV2874542.1 fumarylacetoacetate hydrolase family protein [Defluviimonas sp. WL0050]